MPIFTKKTAVGWYRTGRRRKNPIPFCLIQFFRNMVFPCLISLFIGIIIDSKFYGKFTITIWNFALFNVFKGGSAHFGTHPWHWYFTQGWLPLLTLSSFPTIMGLYKTFPGVKKPTKLFFYLSAFYIGFHSLLAHKVSFLCVMTPDRSLIVQNFLDAQWNRTLQKMVCQLFQP